VNLVGKPYTQRELAVKIRNLLCGEALPQEPA